MQEGKTEATVWKRVLASLNAVNGAGAPSTSGAGALVDGQDSGPARTWQRVAVQAASASGQAYRCVCCLRHVCGWLLHAMACRRPCSLGAGARLVFCLAMCYRSLAGELATCFRAGSGGAASPGVPMHLLMFCKRRMRRLLRKRS